MKDKILGFVVKLKNSWQEKNKKQKGFLIGSVFIAILFIGLIIYFTTKTTMVPLYSDLTPAETGTIKETLDEMGVQSQIAKDGTTILVPEEMVDTLLVELAAQGIPDSGSIDYSFFSKNAGLGMTDNEFNVMKLDAMQTELANLIKKIEGIKDASVMITLPEKGIFVSDQTEEASASIILTTESGYQFSDSQIKALYTLVSKSVPNLPTDNIVIMNQNFEYFDLKNGENIVGNQFETQYAIKKEIERDLERQVQKLLSMLMGQGKVVVSVTADIDFTKETREENLVEPVDDENMEGIAISAQRIRESYNGSENEAGGTPQAEDPADSLGSSYVEGDETNGNYEKSEETINYEVNKIHREIVESPYKIRDIGIQVIAEPPNPEDLSSVTPEIEEGIQQILSTIIRTSINQKEDETELTDEEINNKIAVTFQPLLGKIGTETKTIDEFSLPLWVYIAIGALVIAILLLLLILIFRGRKVRTEERELREQPVEQETFELPDLSEEPLTESVMRRKQIERMAKEQPEEFAKLIRSWLTQD